MIQNRASAPGLDVVTCPGALGPYAAAVRAVVCRALGSLDHLAVEEVPDPVPGAGQVIVEVHAAGANFVDGLIVEGRYQMRPDVPYVPGGEVAGLVGAVGPGVERFSGGEPVLALTGFGGFAEKVAVNASSAALVPPGMDLTLAATFVQSYCTAHFALCERGRMEAGQRVLVLGGGGGIGLAATDLACHLGARVIATASSGRKGQAALGAGAASVVHPVAATLKRAVREATDGQGVDLVVDPVGGELAQAALRTLGREGRYLVVGFASGTIPALPLNQVLLRNRTVVGVDWGAWAVEHPVEQAAMLESLLAMAAGGRLRPAAPARHPLGDTSGVLRAFLDRRAVGKAAIIPSPDR